MKIAFVGAYSGNDHLPGWGGIKRAAAAIGLDAQFFDASITDINTIGDSINVWNPNWTIHGLSDSINSNLTKRIKGKQTLWYCDYTFFEQGHDNPVNGLDTGLTCLLLCNEKQIPIYEKRLGIPVHFVPMASEYRDYQTQTDQVSRVVFEGTMNGGIYEERTRFVRALKERLGNKLEVVDLSNALSCFNEESARMTADFTITLSISATNSAEGYTSPRLFQIPLFGGFPLAASFPGHKDLYRDLPVFEAGNVEDCLEKIKYWLSHDGLREAKKKELIKESIAKHTYQVRLNEIVELLSTYE